MNKTQSRSPEHPQHILQLQHNLAEMQAEISSFLHKNNSTVLPPLSSHQHLLINELNKISSANLSPELKEQLKHRKIDMILNEQRIGGSAIIRNKESESPVNGGTSTAQKGKILTKKLNLRRKQPTTKHKNVEESPLVVSEVKLISRKDSLLEYENNMKRTKLQSLQGRNLEMHGCQINETKNKGFCPVKAKASLIDHELANQPCYNRYFTPHLINIDTSHINNDLTRKLAVSSLDRELSPHKTAFKFGNNKEKPSFDNIKQLFAHSFDNAHKTHNTVHETQNHCPEHKDDNNQQFHVWKEIEAMDTLTSRRNEHQKPLYLRRLYNRNQVATLNIINQPEHPNNYDYSPWEGAEGEPEVPEIVADESVFCL